MGVALVEEKPCRDAMPAFNPSDRPGGLPTMNPLKAAEAVRTFSAVIERCADTGLLVGYVPGFPGAHSQGETLDELQANLQEVIAMLLEDGEPALESDFVGVQQIVVPA
jgi:predicted RNase H-like HicB family nuclease